MLVSLRTLAKTLSLVVFVGCVGSSDSGDEGTVGDGKADGISEFQLVFNTTQAGLIRAKESPRLPGAPAGSAAKFTCETGDRDRTADGWRMRCTRGTEDLTLIYGTDEEAGAAIYTTTVDSPDKRMYFHCAADIVEPGEWPTELHCEYKTPRRLISGQMVSPFTPSLDGVGIFNAHLVAENATTGAKLVRGMKPFRDSDFQDLQDLGVGAVLIFKHPTKASEVPDEIAALTPIGVPESQIVNVDFGWKNFADFAGPCRMTVQSLQLLRDWEASGTTAFFHCTVGEDRTGYLAGLYRLLTEGGSVDSIFENEMCERGYSAGNPQKPFRGVADEIDADMTPVFLKMAYKIATGALTEANLDESVCDTDPADDPAFTGAEWTAENYRCEVSTRYRL